MGTLRHRQFFSTKSVVWGGNSGKTAAPYYAPVIPLAQNLLACFFGIHAGNDPVPHIHNTLIETDLIVDYAMARAYHSYMLTKQAIPKQGPNPLAPALISTPTSL